MEPRGGHEFATEWGKGTNTSEHMSSDSSIEHMSFDSSIEHMSFDSSIDLI